LAILGFRCSETVGGVNLNHEASGRGTGIGEIALAQARVHALCLGLLLAGLRRLQPQIDAAALLDEVLACVALADNRLELPVGPVKRR
jgi:hypothetical protein